MKYKSDGSYYGDQLARLEDTLYGVAVHFSGGGQTKHMHLTKESIPVFIKFLQDFEQNFPKAIEGCNPEKSEEIR